MPRVATAALAVALLAGCATDPSADPVEDAAPASPTATATPDVPASPTATADGQAHPDVVDATLERDGDTWRVSATLSSPYDSPDRYADAWRVVAPDGTVLGVRELLHDHAGEQPFTRSLDGVEIPADVDEVTVEGRDSTHGWGGGTVTVTVPS